MLDFSYQQLERLYIKESCSADKIARILGCSGHKINYWLARYGIKKRTISEAIYLHHNPNGDPFTVCEPKTLEEARLWGLGVGLYWGEGTKASKNAVRLGNTDPALIKIFIRFLINSYRIDPKWLRFGLQIFSDMNPMAELAFWIKTLGIQKNQFHPKVIVTQSGRIGTYRHKSKHGVLTIYFSNKKLRDIINSEVARVAQSVEQRNGNA